MDRKFDSCVQRERPVFLQCICPDTTLSAVPSRQQYVEIEGIPLCDEQ